MKLALLRHAHSIMNGKGIIDYAHICYGLSTEGFAQALTLIPKIENYNPDLIITSPMKRAIQTIEPFLAKKSIEHIISTYLAERNAGEFEGRVESSVREHCEHHGLDRVSFKPIGGESIKEAYERAQKFVEWLRKLDKERVLAVSHSAMAMCLEFVVTGRFIENYYNNSERLRNGELRVFEVSYVKNHLLK